MEAQWTPQRISPLRGWGPMVVLPVAVIVLTPTAWPRWAFMWLLAIILFVGCKWLTWRRTPIPNAQWWQHAGYLFAWPGMDARAFLNPERLPKQDRPAPTAWVFAALKLFAGAILFWGVARRVPDNQRIIFGWVGMVGLILILHFGTFDLLSCAWRSIGIDARPLMDWPLTSVSVSEFWGRRWNRAFRDLTHRLVFRPLSGRLGPRRGILVGFVFSGLLHDLVISLPAGGGYGWPTVFFGIQVAAVFVERSGGGRAFGLGRGWRGWLFTTVILVLPAYGLFHPPFVNNIIVPFMQALGAR